MLLQMMGRIRKLEDNNIYTVADTRTINLDLSKGDRYTYEDIEEIYKMRYGENIDEIFIYNKQEQLNKGLYSFIPEFEQCLKSSGYEFELIDAEIAISKVWSIDEEEFLKADGFDDAVIGVDEGDPMRLIYSVTKCLEVLVAEGMTEEEAQEHFSFNVSGAYLGEKTPIWCHDNFF